MVQPILLAIIAYTIVILVVAEVVTITIVVGTRVATNASFNTWKQTEAILKTIHGNCVFE